jgi:hypothetical protein
LVERKQVNRLWGTEDIPNDANLFLRVHVNQVPDGKLHPGIFREKEGSMSVDWEKYSTAQESRSRAKKPERNGIVALNAGGVRSVDELQVKHEPDEERKNRAHSSVHGLYDPAAQNPDVRKTMIRAELFKIFNQWTIEPNAPVE